MPLSFVYISVCVIGLVISEASRNTRYGTGSVVKTAVRNLQTDYLTDSVQTGSHDTYLSRFALSYGMTSRVV